MHNIEIRRPKIEDKEEIHKFFRTVIVDTFAKEGLSELIDEIEAEIEHKEMYLNSDLESNGNNRYFLLALDGDKVIGTIEYGIANELIKSSTNGELNEMTEIGTVFVHPNYQRQGIGNLLLNVMYLTLQNRGIKEFCLDSGYKNAQRVWKKKFGEPDYLLKNYWSSGNDHMIWRRKLEDVSIVFTL